MNRQKVIIPFVFLLIVSAVNAQNVIVKITNIRNNKGKIVAAVFENAKAFKKEMPVFDKKLSKSNVKSGVMCFKLKLKPGTYGITILDDENNDGKMEYSFIGLPKEGYGFSNFYHTGLSRPKFKDFAFIIGKKDVFIQVKMKYF